MSTRRTASRSGMSRRLRTFVPAAMLFLAVLVAWQIAVVALDVPAYIIPSPTEIAGELVVEGPDLATDLGWTMLEAILGFLVGSGIAIAPLLTIWFGFTLTPKVAIAAIICFFPVLVNTTRGLRAVSSEAFELMRVLSASRLQILWRLRIPSSLPFVFAGLRVAATLSVIGAIVAEFTGSDRGIGYVIVQASYRLDTRLMFAAIVLSCLGGILFFSFIGWLERRALRWPDARLEDR